MFLLWTVSFPYMYARNTISVAMESCRRSGFTQDERGGGGR